MTRKKWFKRPVWWQPFFNRPYDLCRLDPWPCRSERCTNQECIAYWERRNKAIAKHPSSSGLRH